MVIISELGHQRAALSHLRYDSNRNMRDINNHSNYACIMINSIPKLLCKNNNNVLYGAMVGYNSSTVTVPQFCYICSNNLKSVDWSDQE